jgi:hypothetical protein
MLRIGFVLLALLVATAGVPAQAADAGMAGPADTTLLIIRHGEKPAHGRGLDAAGRLRAQAYVPWFSQLSLAGRHAAPSALYASADTRNSARERLTLAPLALALGEPIQLRFGEDQVQALAAHLRANPVSGGTVLICWHHGRMPKLLRALGADPAELLPQGRWPDAVFDWLIVLRYDADGRLVQQQRMRIPVDVPAE